MYSSLLGIVKDVKEFSNDIFKTFNKSNIIIVVATKYSYR